MQVVKLAGVILALLIEVLIDVILAQPLKATSGEKIARPGSHGVMAIKKLHRLVRPMHSEVLAPIARPSDIDEEVEGQRLADVEAGNLKVGGERDQIRSQN